MKRAGVLLVVLVGCGGSKPTATPPTGNEAKTDAGKVATKSEPTCESAAAALIKERGYGSIPEPKREAARRAGEAEVLAACLDDQWSEEAITCTTTRPSPSSCIGQLDRYQQNSFEAHLESWQPNWTGGPGSQYGYGDGAYGGGAYGGYGGYGGSGYGGVVGGVPEEEWISCETNLGEVADYEPVLGPKAVDREFAITLRKSMIGRACNMQWKNEQKKCFGAAKTTGAIASCRATLHTGARNNLTNTLADVASKVASLQALKKSPKAISCKAVTNAHYNDDSLRGRLTALAPDERARVITETRAKLESACTTEKWNATQRACMVQAHGDRGQLDGCFPGDQYVTYMKWSFPGPGVSFKIGIPACDAVTETIKKIATCDKLEQEQKTYLLESIGMMQSQWLEYQGSSEEETAKSCEETKDRYREAAKELGCTSF